MSDKPTDLRIEINLLRNPNGMWEGEANALWYDAGSEHCSCIDSNDGPIFATRVEAASAVSDG
jgi:hypothetical protein